MRTPEVIRALGILQFSQVFNLSYTKSSGEININLQVTGVRLTLTYRCGLSTFSRRVYIVIALNMEKASTIVLKKEIFLKTSL